MTTEQAFTVLATALRDQSSYREVWVANIALAFYDEVRKNPKKTLAEQSTAAAESFVDLLINFKKMRIKMSDEDMDWDFRK